MAFCQKCGAELAPGAQFCAACGTSVSGEDLSIRKKVFVGEQRKCPHCGEILNGYSAVCPACGNDLNKKVNEDIQRFSKELSEKDSEVSDYYAAHANDKTNWWTDWSGGKKVGYVILNIYTLCIPVILHFVFAAMRLASGSTGKMNPAEQKKASLIMNFTVPNDRDGIMEFLNFALSQRDAEEKLMWKSVWNNKCQQIVTKSQAIYSSDHHFVEFLGQKQAEIDVVKAEIKKKIRIPIFCLGAALVVGIILFSVFALGGGSSVSVKERIVEKSEISLLGGAGKLISFADSEIVGLYDSETGDPSFTIEVIANNDVETEVKKQINAAIKNKGWKAADCEQTDVSQFDTWTSKIKFNEKTAENSNNLIKTLLSMKAGDKKKLKIKLTDENAFTKSGRKAYANKVLTADSYTLEFKLEYRIEHRINGKFDSACEITIN